VELCSKYPIHRWTIETDASGYLFSSQPDEFPCLVPLVFCPVVVWQRYTKSCVADPVHKAQAQRSGQSFPVVILYQYESRHSVGLPQQNGGVIRMVQHIGKEDNVEGTVFEWNASAIKVGDGDVSVRTSEHINSLNRYVGSFGPQKRRNQAIATAHVEDTASLRREFSEPVRQDTCSLAQRKFVMQNVKGGRL